MPKKTFYNLPEEKRQKIEQVALMEFADKDYRDVYVTEIIKQSGIAGGSFYQYFEDKQDLFLYMMETIRQDKIRFMQDDAGRNIKSEGFIDLVKATMFSGILFGLKRPLQMRFLDRLMESPIREIAANEVKLAAMDYWENLIAQAVESGELRDDIPAAFLSRALSAASIELSRYTVEKGKLKTLNEQGDRERLEEELWIFAEQFANMFWGGFKKGS